VKSSQGFLCETLAAFHLFFLRCPEQRSEEQDAGDAGGHKGPHAMTALLRPFPEQDAGPTRTPARAPTPLRTSPAPTRSAMVCQNIYP
jgi:hypothetical protein